MANVVVCPSCARKLRLPDHLLGKEVRCPGCKKIFPTKPSSIRRTALNENDLLQGQIDRRDSPPGRELGDGEEETDRPSRRGRSIQKDVMRHRGGMILSLGIISTVCGVIAVPAEFAPNFCSLLCICCLPFGFAGIVLAGLFIVGGLGCGIPAVMMGQADLRMMEDGTRDPAGRGSTRGGWICGIVGMVLAVLSIMATLVLIIFWGALIFTAPATNAPAANPRPGQQNPPRKLSIEPGPLRLNDYPPSLR